MISYGSPFDFKRLYELFAFIRVQKLEQEILYELLPVAYQHPNLDMESVLASLQFSRHDRNSIFSLIPLLREKFAQVNTSQDSGAGQRWVMKKLRKMAIGNIPLPELAQAVRQDARQGGIQ